MRLHRVGSALPVLVLVFSFSPSFTTSPILAQDTAEEIYQAGLYQEEVQGNLERAIDLFGRILVRFPESRAVGAKAQLHIGLCYEKLGQQEAQQAYRRVIAEFPEHAAEVAMARDRLAEIQRSAAELSREPTFRKVEIASRPQNGVISPDGSTLGFVSEGSVWTVPLKGNVRPDMAGEPIRITEPMNAGNAGNILAWSGNGERIAFSVAPKGAIHVVDVATGEVRSIPGNHFRGNKWYDYRLSLSPDGETLAFVHMEREGSTPNCPAGDLFVHTRPVEDGEPTPLAPVCTMQPAFSPDGKHVAYIRVLREGDDPELGRTYRQLWAAPLTGDTPVLLLDSARVWSPVWSADGRMIAVLNNGETGPPGQSVWVVPFEEGEGPQEPIARFSLPSPAEALLAGWTPEGELGVHLGSQSRRAVYTAPANGGKAVQITPDLADSYFPRWTPEGNRIVFTSMLHFDETGWHPVEQAAGDTLSGALEREDYFFGLVSMPPEGGPMVPIRITGDSGVIPGVPPGGGIHVSPDGRTILFAGIRYPETEPGGTPGAEVDIWTVPVEGGEPTRLARSPLQDRFPCWSPDGQEIAFLRYEFRGKGSYAFNIHVVPSEGGEPVPITSDADSVDQATIAYSPDGERIAFFSPGSIKTIQSGGGEPEVLIAGVPPEWEGGRHRLAWSSDGERIAYTAAGKIWIASVSDGSSQELKTGLPAATHYGDFGWSPDGEKFVFLATMGGGVDLWLISDFLPEEVGR